MPLSQQAQGRGRGWTSLRPHKMSKILFKKVGEGISVFEKEIFIIDDYSCNSILKATCLIGIYCGRSSHAPRELGGSRS